MKRLIIFLILPYCFLLGYKNFDTAFAKAETSTYAKATSNCTLYKSQTLNNDVSNIFFIIPETYFVIVLDKITDNCYKVQYDKFIGYVDSTTIIIATFIPIVKTLENITLDIKDTSGTQIWSQPDTNGNILTTISAGFKNINYIASCYGSIPSGGESNLWYYVSFTPSQNSTNVYEGYIYSENTTNLTEIIANTEINPEIIKDNEDFGDVLYFSSSLKTIIIVIITIPIIIFILIILYKSSKKFKEFTNNKNTINKEQNENVFFDNFNQTNHFNNQPTTFNQNNLQNDNKVSLKDNLLKMKNLKFLKRHNLSNNNSNYPLFPDYNPDDDIL